MMQTFKDFRMQVQKFTLVEFIIAFMIVTMNAVGLTSFGYSTHERKIVNSNIIFGYSLVVKITFTLVYGHEIISDFTTNQFDLKNAVKLYSYINISMAIVNYVSALAYTFVSEKYLQNIQLFETLKFFDVSRDMVRSSVMRIVIKSVIFPLVVEATLLVRHLHNEPERHWLWTIYTLLPTLVASIIPNCLFGCFIVFKRLTDTLNARLEEIAKEVNCLQSDLQMQLQKPYYRMQRFCDLADKLDALAEKYSLMCAESLGYTEIVSVPFVCSLLTNLFGITAGFFNQYLALADTLINKESYDVFNAMTNAVFLVISFSEIVLQTYICNDVLVAVRNTGITLQSMTLAHADVRFKQSVEAFSLLVFVTKYKIKPLGLLEVNVSLVHDVLAAVTSFLLILIQSDLTLRFSLK